MAGNAPKSRGMFQYVFKHFLDSFKTLKRKQVGDMKGTDPYGNIYYEIPAQPQLGKRRPTRWYTISEKDTPGRGLEQSKGFDTDLPAEWESWLRFRRDVPPTEEEVMKSLAIAEMKKINAAKLEHLRLQEMKEQGLDTSGPKPQDHEKTPYPKYDEYEIVPGDLEHEKKDRWEKYKNPYMKE